MTLDLTDEEKLALAAEPKRTIAQDRYPLSPRIQTLKAILAKLEPPARLTEPLPPPKHYAAVHSRAVTAGVIRITQSQIASVSAAFLALR